MKSVLVGLFMLLVIGVNCHSWLHCIDYDKSASLKFGQIKASSCNALARGIPSNAVFGEDKGYNYKPTESKPCRDPYSGVINKFKPGQEIRLLWPAKNHVSSPCTNPFVPSKSLKLYA
jgi:hypothetical protein